MLLLCQPLFLLRRGELARCRDKLPRQRHSLLQRCHLLRLCVDEGLVLRVASLCGLTATEGVISAFTLGGDLLGGRQLSDMEEIWDDLGEDVHG